MDGINILGMMQKSGLIEKNTLCFTRSKLSTFAERVKCDWCRCSSVKKSSGSDLTPRIDVTNGYRTNHYEDLMPPPLKTGDIHVGLSLYVCPSIRNSICTSIHPEKFASRVTLKPLVQHTWNFSGILLRVWTCASGCFYPFGLSINAVIGLGLDKNMDL